MKLEFGPYGAWVESLAFIETKRNDLVVSYLLDSYIRNFYGT